MLWLDGLKLSQLPLRLVQAEGSEQETLDTCPADIASVETDQLIGPGDGFGELV